MSNLEVNKKLKTVNVEELLTPCRLQDYAKQHFKDLLYSNTSIKKAIKQGRLIVNGAISSTGYFLKAGDEVSLIAEKETSYKKFNQKLDIIFEDDHLAIINKPAGIATSGNAFKTIYNALSDNLKPSLAKDRLINVNNG